MIVVRPGYGLHDSELILQHGISPGSPQLVHGDRGVFLDQTSIPGF